MKRINIHIDRLLLRGFSSEDKQGIAEGIQLELTRMFSNAESARNLVTQGNKARLRIRSVQISLGTKPLLVGSRVGQAIGKGIRK